MSPTSLHTGIVRLVRLARRLTSPIGERLDSLLSLSVSEYARLAICLKPAPTLRHAPSYLQHKSKSHISVPKFSHHHIAKANISVTARTYSTDKMKNVYKILVAKLGVKSSLGRPRCRWECNIKLDLIKRDVRLWTASNERIISE